VGALPEGVRGRVLAVLILLVLIAAVWVGVVTPASNWYADRQERLLTQQTLARRMAQIAAGLPELRQRAANTQVSAPVAVLEGATDAVAGAGLQQMLQSIAGKAGATLASTEVLPGEQIGEYRRIGVRFAVTAQWPVLVNLLQSITGGSPRMFVNDLQIQGGRGFGNDAGRMLVSSMVVYSFRAGTAS